jgi:sensor domain CHASE-containing protein
VGSGSERSSQGSDVLRFGGVESGSFDLDQVIAGSEANSPAIPELLLTASNDN